MTASLWWIRRDLRLSDNQALDAALQHDDRVIPVFILDPALLGSPFVSQRRLAFMFGGLRQLDADLKQRGSALILRRGRPQIELSRLYEEVSAGAVFAEEDVSPYARRRDAQVGAAVPLHLMPGLSVHPIEAVVKEDGDPYQVFTPYSRAWRSLPRPGDPLPAPDHIDSGDLPDSLPIPDDPQLDLDIVPGEAQAQHLLAAFTTGGDPPIFRYAHDRDLPALAGTSRLSPYLRFGMLSARQAVSAALRALASAPDSDARRHADVWLSELIWREFYISVLHHWPHVHGGSFRPVYDRIHWRNDQTEFDAWCAGTTGFPIVDAAMRQLRESGWMHNRARMIVASFLVKDLLIDWRWGEQWFMQSLLDGDPAANNGGWQWAAGTGTDAAPYFRIFNPTTQGRKYDPAGDYVRRWVPELQKVPEKYIHTPHSMPDDVQRDSGCVIGIDYPAPIVDHGAARERTLEAYKAARDA